MNFDVVAELRKTNFYRIQNLVPELAEALRDLSWEVLNAPNSRSARYFAMTATEVLAKYDKEATK